MRRKLQFNQIQQGGGGSESKSRAFHVPSGIQDPKILEQHLFNQAIKQLRSNGFSDGQINAMLRAQAAAKVAKRFGKTADELFGEEISRKQENAKERRSRLMNTILSASVGFVHKLHNSVRGKIYGVVESHTGKEAPLEARAIFGSLEKGGYQKVPGQSISPWSLLWDNSDYYGEMDKPSRDMCPWDCYIECLAINDLDSELSIVGFRSGCFSEYGDSKGPSGGEIMVVWLMPTKTAHELREFLLREDISFILEMYNKTFPKTCVEDPVAFSWRSMFIESGENKYPLGEIDIKQHPKCSSAFLSKAD